MANTETKNRNLKSAFMLIFVLVLSFMVLLEISTNITEEIAELNFARATATSPASGINGTAGPTPTLFEVLPLE